MPWEPLPDRDWAPTIRSLHRWSQIVGKVRMDLAAPMNHWWHVTLVRERAGPDDITDPLSATVSSSSSSTCTRTC